MFSLFGEVKRERRAHLRSIYKSRYGLDLALGCVNERHWMDSAGWGTKEDINSALAPFWVQAKRCHCWAGAPSGLNELKRNSSKSWTTQKELKEEDEGYLASSYILSCTNSFQCSMFKLNQSTTRMNASPQQLAGLRLGLGGRVEKKIWTKQAQRQSRTGLSGSYTKSFSLTHWHWWKAHCLTAHQRQRFSSLKRWICGWEANLSWTCVIWAWVKVCCVPQWNICYLWMNPLVNTISEGIYGNAVCTKCVK